MDSIGDLLKNRISSSKPLRKPRKLSQWQIEAINAIPQLADGKEYSSSIFSCYKKNTHRAKTVLLDCIELGKPFSKYFLKAFKNTVDK